MRFLRRLTYPMPHAEGTLSFVGRRSATARRPNPVYLLALILAFALPFESITRPVLEIPGLRLTNLELIVGIALGGWALAFAASFVAGASPRARADFRLPPRILGLPVVAFLVVAFLSAIVAPELRSEALKFVGRLAAGAGVFLLVSTTAVTAGRFAGLLWALSLGAGCSALIGFAQAAGISDLGDFLSLFAATPTRVGGNLRVNGTFQYATITSMYFEMIAPLTIGLAAATSNRSARLIASAILVGAVAIVVLTLTRSGLVSLAAACGLLLLFPRLRPVWRPLARPALAAMISLLGITAFLTMQPGSFLTRLTTENDLNWYGASYRVPSTLTLANREAMTVTVEARNTGQATWTTEGAHPYALGYRWLSDDGESALDTPHSEILLPRDVAPGESVQLSVPVRATLPPGRYRLGWSMLQQDILWFRHRDQPEAETAVTVSRGPTASDLPAPAAAGPRDEKPPIPVTIPRRQLWPVALQMLAERPLLGVGPDNFRLLYGRYLGLDTWDAGLHANNLYLEMLADLGLIGAAAFAWLLAATGVVLIRILRRAPPGSVALWAAALSAALLAFLVHGLVDYFLEFTSLYALFWLVIGLVAALPRLAGDNGSELADTAGAGSTGAPDS